MALPRLRLRDDRWERAIDGIDPVTGAHTIFGILFDRVFPLDLFLSSELGQLRTFAVPSISRLLHSTRQYEDEGRRRVDDTKAILSEIIIPGPRSAGGRAMMDHLNKIHGHYVISNDDMLTTLAALAVAPIEHVARFAHRPMRPREQAAWYEVWRQVGVGMGISDVPSRFEELRDFRDRYEARVVRFDPANAAVAQALLAVLRDELPPALRPLVEPTAVVLLAAPHIAAGLGLRPPTPAERRFILAGLAGRRVVERKVTAFAHQRFSETRLFRHLPSYPRGYERHMLGPRKLIAKMLAGSTAAARASAAAR